MTIPFTEQNTKVRGVLDVVSGCYPGFLFGRELSDILPVFHFHDVTTDYLEPYFKYLSDNGYKAVTAKDIGIFVREGVLPEGKCVALCFDDAFASVYSVVEPLLKKYALKAITYVAPALIDDETMSGNFVTWEQLKEMSDGGFVDIQSHTWSHAKIYSDCALDSFIKPGYADSSMSRPVLELGDVVRRCSPEMLGCPLYEARSRMSDALRYIDDSSVREKCLKHVSDNGKADYFKRSGWREELIGILRTGDGRYETEREREDAIRFELEQSKRFLEEKLDNAIIQVCMPWGIGGELAELFASDAGYETMVADELLGKRFVVKGGNPYRIMRLKHRYIFCLPGKGRQTIFSI